MSVRAMRPPRPRPARRPFRPALAAGLLLGGLVAGTSPVLAARLTAAAIGGAADPAGPSAAPVERRIDHWMRRGAEDRAAAVPALRAIGDELEAATPALQRLLLYAEAQVEAREGRPEARELAARLRTRSERDGDPLAEAAANLIDADLADAAGRTDRAGELAQRAWVPLAAACGVPIAAEEPPATGGDRTAALATLPGSATRLPAGCDHRLAWRALELMQRHETARGAVSLAASHAAQARALAWRADDPWRQAQASAVLAYLLTALGRADAGQTLLRDAQRLAAVLGDPELQARTMLVEGSIASRAGRAAEARAAAERGIALAREAAAPRLEALLLNNLADAEAKAGRPARALRAVEQALPVARQHGDQRLELSLLHNAALARIGLGRIDEARPEIERLVELERGSGRLADAAAQLREFIAALAAAGAPAEALALYHRERALTGELDAMNRAAALERLRQANDAGRKQREIALLARDNELKAEALANHDLRLGIAVLATLVVALGGAVAGLLALRLREVRRHLVASEARLRVQSERDPLTQLANRRHFLAVMNGRSDGGAFGGALLLIDIDHFKQVNDRLGHAAGDAVLVEIARRLAEAVRADDLVVRWGGEEFLVLARDVAGPQLDALARRILASVGATPVGRALSSADAPLPRVGTGPALLVSASIGYARFPLPPDRTAMGWEQALRLVDLALGLAKRRGRNRAIGVMAMQGAAGTSAGEDFEAAIADGRISLHVELGPLPAAGPAGAAVTREDGQHPPRDAAA